jgi:hypothetical protein
MHKGMSLKTSCDLACSKILKMYVLIVTMLIQFKVYNIFFRLHLLFQKTLTDVLNQSLVLLTWGSNWDIKIWRFL